MNVTYFNDLINEYVYYVPLFKTFSKNNFVDYPDDHWKTFQWFLILSNSKINTHMPQRKNSPLHLTYSLCNWRN